ncbi:hypothetical protein EDB19DRAFT_1937408 [Suillus lakei]|nr:hypothetical protein EDB19DRAFT_1937408 [Suillus lakei]
MSSFQQLIQQLELSSDAITTASISSLFRFITIGTTLKNDIILTEPSSTPIDKPPNVLPPAIAKFLGAGCSISPAQVSDAWALLKDIIWTGGIKMDTGELWETEGMHRGVAEHLLYPPSSYCVEPNCSHHAKGMMLNKRNQLIFTAKRVRLIITTITVYLKGNGHTMYKDQPLNIQVAEHVYMAKEVIELFKTAMDLVWTSATNCAWLYNLCLSHGKQAPASYGVKFEVYIDHVWDGYVISSLLEDCKHRKCSLIIPHTGEQRDRFTTAMIARNRQTQLYGYDDRFSTVLWHPAFLWHFAFNEVYSPFPHSHASNALPSSPTTLSDNLSISQTMQNCTNTSKTASLFILSSSPYHFQSSSAAYIRRTIQTIIHSHLTFMITVDTMPFHPNAHQRLQTTKSLCR